MGITNAAAGSLTFATRPVMLRAAAECGAEDFLPTRAGAPCLRFLEQLRHLRTQLISYHLVEALRA